MDWDEVRFRKLKILRGDARRVAKEAGAKDEEDLVLLYSKLTSCGMQYKAELVEGDAVSWMMRPASGDEK